MDVRNRDVGDVEVGGRSRRSIAHEPGTVGELHDGRTWWKPEVRTVQRIFASGSLKSTKLSRSRSAARSRRRGARPQIHGIDLGLAAHGDELNLLRRRTVQLELELWARNAGLRRGHAP